MAEASAGKRTGVNLFAGDAGSQRRVTMLQTLYQQNNQQFNPRFTVTGRNLAHAKRSVLECAFIGADLHLDHGGLVSPTVKQAAYLAGVCVPYVRAAIVLADDRAAREAVLAGEINLFDAVRANTAESLVAHFRRSSVEEWRACAREIGPALIWDQMLAPIV
jgi:hypothetical protein